MWCRQPWRVLLREDHTQFLASRQCPESYEAQHDGSLFNTGQECHRLVDAAHCAPLGCAARKARRALPGQKARRAAEA